VTPPEAWCESQAESGEGGPEGLVVVSVGAGAREHSSDMRAQERRPIADVERANHLHGTQSPVAQRGPGLRGSFSTA
jgi:hypothetical protein